MIVTYSRFVGSYIYAVVNHEGSCTHYRYYPDTDALVDLAGNGMLERPQREEVIFAILQHRATDTRIKARVC